MEYNTQYLDIHYALLDAFMIKISKGILDISYTKEKKIIIIQIVMLEGTNLSSKVESKVRSNLPEFEIKIHKLFITKERFNENKGGWNPIYYNWLGHLLFSKAEVL